MGGNPLNLPFPKKVVFQTSLYFTYFPSRSPKKNYSKQVIISHVFHLLMFAFVLKKIYSFYLLMFVKPYPLKC